MKKIIVAFLAVLATAIVVQLALIFVPFIYYMYKALERMG